jgi:hypothetical protein
MFEFFGKAVEDKLDGVQVAINLLCIQSCLILLVDAFSPDLRVDVRIRNLTVLFSTNIVFALLQSLDTNMEAIKLMSGSIGTGRTLSFS